MPKLLYIPFTTTFEAEEIKLWYLEHTWNRSILFKHVSHNTVGGPNRQSCNTIGGATPGKPCAFPFVFPDCELSPKPPVCYSEDTKTPITYTHCAILTETSPWCSTRTHENNSHVPSVWGYCPTECTGESYQQEDDLSADHYSNFWTENLYLMISDIGHCQTYDPSYPSLANHNGQFYALLGWLFYHFLLSLICVICITGDKAHSRENDQYDGYNIYIHDRDQFWTGSEMDILGQTHAMFVPPNTELECSFFKSVKTHLDKPDEPCADDPRYSFTSCIFLFISSSFGCHIDWFDFNMEKQFPPCTDREEMILYKKMMDLVSTASWIELKNLTGCIAKCTVNHYSFSECQKEDVTWKHDWSSSFYLAAERTRIRTEEEFLAFDIPDTINGIGGALGLFLGWSLLFLIEQCTSVTINAFRYFLIEIGYTP